MVLYILMSILGFTYEGKCVTFAFLNLISFALYDVLKAASLNGQIAVYESKNRVLTPCLTVPGLDKGLEIHSMNSLNSFLA